MNAVPISLVLLGISRLLVCPMRVAYCVHDVYLCTALQITEPYCLSLCVLHLLHLSHLHRVLLVIVLPPIVLSHKAVLQGASPLAERL